MSPSIPYRGRFAPSPTGPLHFGSLVAAVGSYADALAHRGEWLVRMEDVDEGRSMAGAADDILRTLEAFGFRWHGEVLHQSRRKARYREVMEELSRRGLAYPCGCTRREVEQLGTPGVEGPVYPGICRDGLPAGKRPRAVRLRVPEEKICFEDAIHGLQCQQLAREVGDFVIRRADGFFAYQLAVVVDDFDQEITRVVRGADLLLSTPRQIHLQRLLDAPLPRYAHLPLVLDEAGRKLSKRDRDHPVDPARPLEGLLAAWRFLGQLPPEEPPTGTEEFWEWAALSWDPARVPRVQAQ